MVREDHPGDQRLVAYVVPDKDGKPSQDTLRAYLRDQLPDYMIPSAFVMLESMPLTPNGKINREALPALGAAASGEEGFVEPCDETEEAIAAIWRRALHVERIGINDNFFEIGGHSILLGEVHARLQQQFHTQIVITDLFRYPTISSLAPILGSVLGKPRIISRVHRGRRWVTASPSSGTRLNVSSN